MAYRYQSKGHPGLLHISVITKGDKLPKYGNYYIGEKTSDYIFHATWNKNNELIFSSNKLGSNMVQYYFVKSGPPVKHVIIYNDTRYQDKYLWVG